MVKHPQFASTTLGGTFDHFHAGHEALIQRAFEISQKVYLGITSDQYISKHLIHKDIYAYLIEPYLEREAVVKSFLKELGLLARTEIIPIDDKYGTTLADANLVSIVVSPETEVVAAEINELRHQKGWNELFISKVDWVLAQDGKPIHSMRIRAGEIGPMGEIFSLPSNWGVRRLSEKLRTQLKKPLGRLIIDRSGNFDVVIEDFIKQYHPASATVIAVGDAVTNSLLTAGITPQLSIIDLSVERHSIYSSVPDLGFKDIKVLKKVKSPAGTLSYEGFNLTTELAHLASKPNVLQVVGEEDLFALFAILSAPLKTLVLYGQPKEGIVIVEVGIEKKQEAVGYLGQFL